MARDRDYYTDAGIKRQLQSDYGLGEGRKYKPWIRAQDVNVHSKKVMGITTRRTHHLLSQEEKDFFLTADFSEDVVDIREQFQLFPRGLAEEIASHIGVPYPKYKKVRLS